MPDSVATEGDRLWSTIEASEPDAPALALAPSVERRKPKDNREKRLAAWQEVFEDSDATGLTILHDALNRIRHYAGRIKTTPTRTLSAFEARSLMIEHTAISTIAEALEGRRLQIRQMVFRSISKRLESQGARDADNTNGDLPVPEMGKRFVREGCGYNDSEVDWEYLRRELDEGEWEKIVRIEEVPERIIPAHTIEHRDRDALAEFLENNQHRLPVIRAATSRGAPKSPRFTVKDIDDNDTNGHTP